MIDKRILSILSAEGIRQADTIELIASENFASDDVMQLCGSIFTNKYAEGLPGKRYYNGCDNADDVENLAIEYATKLFGVTLRMCNLTVAPMLTWQCLQHS